MFTLEFFVYFEPTHRVFHMIKKRNIVTLKEVADRLGVSVATVSNAFNRPDQLSQALRDNILNACREWGYRGPQASSRKRRTDKTRVVGVMLSNALSYSFSDPMANQILEGLADIFETTDYNLLIIPSRKSLQALDGIQGFVDGFIVYGPPAQDRLKLLMQNKRSLIAIDFYAEGLTCVNIDNRLAARRIASHAFTHPVERAAVIGLRISDCQSVTSLDQTTRLDHQSHIMVQRLLGFRDAAEKAGIVLNDADIWHLPDNTSRLAKELSSALLAGERRPQVLLCMSDTIAVAAAETAREQGLCVGKDILITGFDGIEKAALTNEGITTIAQPHKEKGRIAADLFLGQLPQQDQCLPTELKIRESCPYYSPA